MHRTLTVVIATFAMASVIGSADAADVIQTLYADKDSQTAWVKLLGDSTWYSGDGAMSRMFGAAVAGSAVAVGYHAGPPNLFGYRSFDYLEFDNPLGGNFVEAPGRIYAIRAIQPGAVNTWYQQDFGNKNGAVAFVRFNGPNSSPASGHLAVGPSQVETAMSALSRDLPVTYAEGCVYVLVSGTVEPVCNVFDWIQVAH